MKRLWLFCSIVAIIGTGCSSPGSTLGSLPPQSVDASGIKIAASPQHAPPALLVEPSKIGATVSSLVLGANMADWYNVTQPNLVTAFQTAGLKATRWPGGSQSDIYHWKANSLGQGKCSKSYVAADSNFDNFMTDIAQGATLDVAVTVNYGSNPACTDGADPSEAAGWVKYANDTKHYGIKWWSVGNEQYGSWETDLHSRPHSAAQYATNVAKYFYPQMKAASSTPINVCVDVDPHASGWDVTVLKRAKYDCVELHYYAQGNTVNDSYIVDRGAPNLTTYIDELRSELKTAGHPSTPIYLGEIGSTYGTPGKQTMSITQALFAGQVVGELLNDGVARATWWLGYGGCNSESAGGDFSSSLYGWQNFGGYMLFSDGSGPSSDNCTTSIVPTGTLLPTARALQVASHFVRDGEHMLGTTRTGLPKVRAYASTYDGGYSLLLFNLGEVAAVSVPVKIAGKASGKGGTIVTYDRALYDASKNNVWNAPTTTKLAAWKNSFTVNLAPWSITAVVTK